MRSVYPDSEGMPVLPAGTFVTTEQSPLKERWGGWYADGKLPDIGMANAVTSNPEDHPEQLTHSMASLDQQFDTSPYLTAHSDAVAAAGSGTSNAPAQFAVASRGRDGESHSR